MVRSLRVTAPLVVLLVLLANLWISIGTSTATTDFLPLRHAGEALLDGRSVYTDHAFVYPPSAALLFVPLTTGTVADASRAWIVVGLLAQVVAAWLIVRSAGRPLSSVAGPMLLLGMSSILTRALLIGNLSIVFVPLAVAVLAAFHRGRWGLGCGLLVATLLVKPLLVALVIVPIVRRRWKPLGVSLAAGVGVLTVSLLTVPGAANVTRWVGYVASGTNLRGKSAVLNLSLAGWGRAHEVAPPYITAGRVAVAMILVLLAWTVIHRKPSAGTLQLGLGAYVSVLLCGPLSEIHYLQIMLALVVLRMFVMPSFRAVIVYAVPLAMCYLPSSVVPASIAGQFGQNWLVAAEIVTLLAVSADVALGVRQARDFQQSPASRDARSLEQRGVDGGGLELAH